MGVLPPLSLIRIGERGRIVRGFAARVIDRHTMGQAAIRIPAQMDAVLAGRVVPFAFIAITDGLHGQGQHGGAPVYLAHQITLLADRIRHRAGRRIPRRVHLLTHLRARQRMVDVLEQRRDVGCDQQRVICLAGQQAADKRIAQRLSKRIEVEVVAAHHVGALAGVEPRFAQHGLSVGRSGRVTARDIRICFKQ